MSDAFNQMLAQGPTPIKFADPVNQMAQLMQLKNAQQTGVVNQMAIDKGQREITQKNALNAAYQRNIGSDGKFNFSGLSQDLASSGQGELVPDILKQKQEYETGQNTAAKAQTDRIVGGLELTQNALSRIDPYSPNAGEQMKSIFSGAHKDPVLGAWLDSNGQTEAATHATVDDAVSKGTMPALYLQSMSSAKSIQDRLAKSPYGRTTKMVGPQGPGVYQQNSQTGEYSLVGGIPQTDGTTINMPPGEKAFDVAAGKAGAAKTLAQSDAASGAQAEIDNAKEIIRLAPNAITGFGGDFQLKAAKFGKALGLEDLFDKDGKIVDSENLGIKLGTKVLQEAKGAGAALGAGKSFTDKDLEMVAKVAGGSQALDAATLIIMAKISKEIAQKKYANYRKTYAALSPENKKMFFDPSADLVDEPATAPVASGAEAPAPIQIKNNEEWAKLPVGQEFLDPNGVKRVKQ